MPPNPPSSAPSCDPLSDAPKPPISCPREFCWELLNEPPKPPNSAPSCAGWTAPVPKPPRTVPKSPRPNDAPNPPNTEPSSLLVSVPPIPPNKAPKTLGSATSTVSTRNWPSAVNSDVFIDCRKRLFPSPKSKDPRIPPSTVSSPAPAVTRIRNPPSKAPKSPADTCVSPPNPLISDMAADDVGACTKRLLPPPRSYVPNNPPTTSSSPSPANMVRRKAPSKSPNCSVGRTSPNAPSKLPSSLASIEAPKLPSRSLS